LICTSDASHLVFGNHLLDARLHLDVPLHEGHVGDVDGEQDEGLPPEDAVVPEEVDQHQQADAVERAVAEQRPPGERQYLPTYSWGSYSYTKSIHTKINGGKWAQSDWKLCRTTESIYPVWE